MKKIIIVAVVSLAATISVIKANETTLSNNMTELQMENVELLAEGEPSEEDCNVCNKNDDWHCDIAYRGSESDFRRCEGYIPPKYK